MSSQRIVPGIMPCLKRLAQSLAGLWALLVLAGCAGSLSAFDYPTTSEYLDGDYQVLAACTYKRLSSSQGRFILTKLPEQGAARITFVTGSTRHWELSFVNADEGRQTRMEGKSLDGTYPDESMLALARACAA